VIENGWWEGITSYGAMCKHQPDSVSFIGGNFWDIGTMANACISVGNGTTGASGVSVKGVHFTQIKAKGIWRQAGGNVDNLSIENCLLSPFDTSSIGVQLDDSNTVNGKEINNTFSGTWGTNKKNPLASRMHMVSNNDEGYIRLKQLIPVYGVNKEAISAAKTLAATDATTQFLDPDSAGASVAVNTPGISTFSIVSKYCIYNTGATWSLNVKKVGGTNLIVLAPGEAAIIMNDGDTVTGDWFVMSTNV
jgi:hypothetical protein